MVECLRSWCKSVKEQVFIINGSGGVGKDAFIEMVYNQSYEPSKNRYVKVANHSSVTKVKEVAKIIGWDGTKTERNRKFLSDLKLLTTEYNDMPLNDMAEFANNFMSYNVDVSKMLFLHIREPKEIVKAIDKFKEYDVKTILVKRDSVKHINSNMSDENVYNYDYNITINNNGTLEDLKEKANCFLDDFLEGTFKNEY